MSATLLIRADASREIGLGHLMRCLALAQAWQDDGGRAVMATHAPSAQLDGRLAAESIERVAVDHPPGSDDDARALIRLAREQRAAWVVVDGYQFDAAYQRAIKAAGLRVLWMDDTGAAADAVADVVLNQNPHARPEAYDRRAADTALLLGPRYALLRREFLAWQRWQRRIPQVAANVLVTMGGADPANVSARVIDSLARVAPGRIAVTVAAGTCHPHDEMPGLMAWADVAVSGAGSTCWELAFMGVPSIVVILADNQRPIAEQLAAMEAVVNAGWHAGVTAEGFSERVAGLVGDPSRRAALQQRAQALIDGYGACRVVARLTGAQLCLRPARPADCRLLWEWVNDPAVRAASFSTRPILWDEHVDWYGRALADPTCVIFIAEDLGGRPLGQIRFTATDAAAVDVHLSIAEPARGAGRAPLLLRLGIARLVRSRRVERIRALIRPSNAASMRAFERAGFLSTGPTTVNGHQAVCYVFDAQRNYGCP